MGGRGSSSGGGGGGGGGGQASVTTMFGAGGGDPATDKQIAYAEKIQAELRETGSLSMDDYASYNPDGRRAQSRGNMDASKGEFNGTIKTQAQYDRARLGPLKTSYSEWQARKQTMRTVDVRKLSKSQISRYIDVSKTSTFRPS